MNHVLLVEHFVGKDGAVDNEFQNPNRLSDLCGRIGFWLDSGGEWALVKFCKMTEWALRDSNPRPAECKWELIRWRMSVMVDFVDIY